MIKALCLALLFASLVTGGSALPQTSPSPTLRSRPTIRPAKSSHLRGGLGDSASTGGMPSEPTRVSAGESTRDPAPLPVGLTWIPSDFRTENATLPPASAPTPTILTSGSPVGVSWTPSDLRVSNSSMVAMFPRASRSTTSLTTPP